VGHWGYHWLGNHDRTGGVRLQATARYEENPPLAGKRLWSRSALAGLFFVVLQSLLDGTSYAAGEFLGWNRDAVFWAAWLLVYAPLAVVFLVWVFDLDNLLQGLSVFVLFLILPLFIGLVLGFMLELLGLQVG
jgi:hypothetical protein